MLKLTDFADRYWPVVFIGVILSAMITGITVLTNIILMPEIPNYTVYFFGIQTLILLGVFLFLWFQPKDRRMD